MIRIFAKPFQAILIQRRMCVGCTHPLDKAIKQPYRDKRAMVTCKCNRRYILNVDTNEYRRATSEEEKEFLNKSPIYK